jgi:hypothetical protein
MGFDERRKRSLTPMSGELRTESDWTPTKPEEKVRRRQKTSKRKEVPSTRGRVLLAGLRRSIVALVLMAAVICGAALLIVHFSDMSPSRVFPLAFYLGGAFIALGGFLGAMTGPSVDWIPEGGFGRYDHETALNRSAVYGVFGVLLIGVGAVIDWFV